MTLKGKRDESHVLTNFLARLPDENGRAPLAPGAGITDPKLESVSDEKC